MGKLVKYLGGIFMALTILSPVMDLELPDVEGWFAIAVDEGAEAAAAGEEMADEQLRGIISDRVEAYILDKAAGYGAALEVEVKLDETGIPVEVILYGPVTPAARAGLERVIARELGIGEEAQHWTG